jgi:ankyrin repeat protein
MDIDERDKHGQTLLFYAVMRRHQETAKILLDAGANPNIKYGKRGDTSLCIGVRFGNAERVKLLIQHQVVAMEETNTEGYSPLMIGVLLGYKDDLPF